MRSGCHFVVVIFACAVGSEALPAQRCDSLAWTEPRPIAMRDGRPVYVEAPYPARFSGGWALFGTPTFVWRGATIFADTAAAAAPAYIASDTLAGVIVDMGRPPAARVVGMPRTTSRMLSPRAVRNPAGTLDVFWGETADTSAESRFHVAEVWHAPYGAAGWGEAELVLARAEIDWNDTDPAVAVVGGAPAIAVPVSLRQINADSVGIEFVRRDSVGWRATLIATGDPQPTNVVLDTARDGATVLGFTGTLRVPRRAPIASAVVVVRSADRGASWSPPRVVSGADQGRVYSLQLVHAAAGVLTLVWGSDASSAGGGFAIARATSVNDGRSWTLEPVFATDTLLQPILSAASGDGVFIVARNWSTRAMRAGTVRGSDTLHLTSLPFEAAASLPRLTSTDASTALLVWGARREHAYPVFPAFAAPLLLSSTLSLRCSAGP